MAPKNRITTCQSSYRFRQSNKSVMTIPEKKIVHPLHNRKPSLQIQMSLDPECAYSFGMPNRPSTPIRTVICGTYGNVAEYDQLNRNAAIKQEQQYVKSSAKPRNPTKAMIMADLSRREYTDKNLTSKHEN